MERKLRSGRFVSTLSAHAIPTFSHHKIRLGPKKKPSPSVPLPLSLSLERKTNTAEPSIARKAQTQTPKNPPRLHPHQYSVLGVEHTLHLQKDEHIQPASSLHIKQQHQLPTHHHRVTLHLIYPSSQSFKHAHPFIFDFSRVQSSKINAS